MQNPITGKNQVAGCIDDYFGKHQYGYAFKRDGSDFEFGGTTIDGACDVFKEDEIDWEVQVQIKKEENVFEGEIKSVEFHSFVPNQPQAVTLGKKTHIVIDHRCDELNIIRGGKTYQINLPKHD